MASLPAAAAAVLIATAPAPAVSTGPEAVSITLYHDSGVSTSDLLRPDSSQAPNVRSVGLALVTETRTVDVPAGPAEIRFEGVASTMVPQTVNIQGLPSGIVEQNFDYDLLTPGALLEKSIGAPVRIVRTDPKTGRRSEDDAIVRSAPNGVVLEINGKFEALGCSGLPDKLVFDGIPPGLTDKPTLSIRTDAPVARHYTVTLSYLATGLNWSADYVARLRPGSDSLDLTGWLTLANFSTTEFARAPIGAVAGHLALTGDDLPVDPNQLSLDTGCWPTDINWAKIAQAMAMLPPPPPPPPAPAPAPEAGAMVEDIVVTAEKRTTMQQLGDYKLYTLNEPTTLAAQQTKQIQFLAQPDVPFERLYVFDSDLAFNTLPDEGNDVNLLLRLQNRTDRGLGLPMPAGNVTVTESGADGVPILTGQAGIADKGVGLPVELTLGLAMNVVVTRHVTDVSTVGPKDAPRTQATLEIGVTNDKPAPIAFQVRQDIPPDGTRIVSESQDHDTGPGRAEWTLPLKPGETKTVRYTIDTPD
jgi:hypothetical protein